ncbi:MAG: PilT/PilU family type 4a pilus ATPase [Calditrichaeota bacterium]|nr:PilT/PilU family type 4a pilus ATPase [Calditrichota bacterium]
MEIKVFEDLLKASVDSGASDIHIKVGSPFTVRHGKDLLHVTEERLSVNDVERIVELILSRKIKQDDDTVKTTNLAQITELDTSFGQRNVGRFRVNIYRQRNSLALAMRIIPPEVPTIEKLLLPEVLKEIALEPRGLILVTGATGSGKSSTLAAMMNHVNNNRSCKIITIEDPIEFLIPDNKSAISQREVGNDTASFNTALRAALRQDPDIILVGEMRDKESVEIALKAAETGHTVFSTVHTLDAVRTITRLITTFNAGEHAIVRMRLGESLKAIISQRLIPHIDGKNRIAAVEIMRMTKAIQDRILLGDPKGFFDLIEGGTNPYKMQTFDQHLTTLYKNETISFETAMIAATSPTNFKRNLQFEGN